MYDNNNIFAKIIREEVPCNKIDENDYALSFYDVNPRAKIHFLVIPKGEYKDIVEFTQKASSLEVKGFFDVFNDTLKKLNVSDFKTQANTGKTAGQEVFHFHLHVMSN